MHLVIGGGSCVGKTVAAQALSAGLGLQHIEIDALINASEHPDLRFDGHNPTVWDQEPAELQELLAQKGLALEAYLPRWLGQFSSGQGGILLEGEGVLPQSCVDLADLPGIRFAFIVEHDADVMRATLTTRSQAFRSLDPARRDAVVETNRLYNDWIAQQATQYGQPCVDSQPWNSLPSRLLRAL